jgi:CheY-like chemotaxis protein
MGEGTEVVGYIRVSTDAQAEDRSGGKSGRLDDRPYLRRGHRAVFDSFVGFASHGSWKTGETITAHGLTYPPKRVAPRARPVPARLVFGHPHREYGGARSEGRRVRRSPHPASATKPGEFRATRQLRVLLVDDDAALRVIYRFNLEASGVSVIEAEDGESALGLLAEGDLPDVVLLDVMMPGIDGWELAARLRADERTRALPVIFITARAEDESRARCADLGAVGYLVKPFNPTTLAETVERLLADGRTESGSE